LSVNCPSYQLENVQDLSQSQRHPLFEKLPWAKLNKSHWEIHSSSWKKKRLSFFQAQHEPTTNCPQTKRKNLQNNRLIPNNLSEKHKKPTYQLPYPNKEEESHLNKTSVKCKTCRQDILQAAPSKCPYCGGREFVSGEEAALLDGGILEEGIVESITLRCPYCGERQMINSQSEQTTCKKCRKEFKIPEKTKGLF
jgi:DNA-directed RNA polymerase subunit RPC12/RpoP